MSGGADDQSVVTEVVAELVRVRHRGVSQLNASRAPLEPVQVPEIERLAAAYDGKQRSRLVQIQQLLDDALTSYRECDPYSAGFIRRLLADEQGRWPGPTGASGLLAQARRIEGVDDENRFRQIQRQHFLEFAPFLIEFVEQKIAPPATEKTPLADETSSDVLVAAPRSPGRRRAVLAAGTAVVVIGGVITAVTIANDSSNTPSAGTSSSASRSATRSGSRTNTASTSTTASAPAEVMFRFDSLGSTFSSIMNVYPGVKPTEADKLPNGTYENHELVTAVCITTGRRVTSDPRYHETARSSDQWVQIQSTNDLLQYASLTYGDLVPRGRQVPACKHAQ